MIAISLIGEFLYKKKRRRINMFTKTVDWSNGLKIARDESWYSPVSTLLKTF